MLKFSFVCFVLSAVCVIGAIQERKDFLRSVGFGMVAAMLLVIGVIVLL